MFPGWAFTGVTSISHATLTTQLQDRSTRNSLPPDAKIYFVKNNFFRTMKNTSCTIVKIFKFHITLRELFGPNGFVASFRKGVWLISRYPFA